MAAKDDGLGMLMEAGIISPKATIEDMMRVSAQLDGEFADSGEVSKAWAFIVKGKFIFKDSEDDEDPKPEIPDDKPEDEPKDEGPDGGDGPRGPVGGIPRL